MAETDGRPGCLIGLLVYVVLPLSCIVSGENSRKPEEAAKIASERMQQIARGLGHDCKSLECALFKLRDPKIDLRFGENYKANHNLTRIAVEALKRKGLACTPGDMISPPPAIEISEFMDDIHVVVANGPHVAFKDYPVPEKYRGLNETVARAIVQDVGERWQKANAQ